MRFRTSCVSRQVLVVGALALDQVGHGVEPQPVDAEFEPEAHHAQHRLEHLRIVEIEVGLVRVEAVPVIGAGDRIPGPVRALGIEEDDARAGVFLVGVRPDVEIAPRRSRLGAWRARWNQGCWSEVWLITSSVMTRMPRAMRRANEMAEVGHRAVVGMHVAIVADVVAVIEPRRGIERQQPDRVDAEIGDVVELGDQAGKSPMPSLLVSKNDLTCSW